MRLWTLLVIVVAILLEAPCAVAFSCVGAGWGWGEIEYLIDPDTMLAGVFILLVGSPKPDKEKVREQTEQ